MRTRVSKLHHCWTIQTFMGNEGADSVPTQKYAELPHNIQEKVNLLYLVDVDTDVAGLGFRAGLHTFYLDEP